jgi:hypothetical protein
MVKEMVNTIEPLSREQIEMLTRFIGYFSGPGEGGMLIIPTGTKTFHPTPNSLNRKTLPILDKNGENLIYEALRLGILSEIMDHRERSAGDLFESQPLATDYDPDAGITLVFSDKALEYLEKNGELKHN